MEDRLTLVGLQNSEDDSMSFALILDTANDGSGGEVSLFVRSDQWVNSSNGFPEILRDDPIDEIHFDPLKGMHMLNRRHIVSFG